MFHSENPAGWLMVKNPAGSFQQFASSINSRVPMDLSTILDSTLFINSLYLTNDFKPPIVVNDGKNPRLMLVNDG